MQLARRFGKILLYVLICLILLFGIIAWLVQVPSIQTQLTQRVAKVLTEELKADVRVGGVAIDFFKTGVLKEVLLKDQSGDTLLVAGRIGVEIGLFDLIQHKIVLQSIHLADTDIRLYALTDTQAFNYQFLLDHFSSDATAATSSASWSFDIDELQLEQVRFEMKDVHSRFFELTAVVDHCRVTTEELDLLQQKIVLDEVQLNESKIVFRQFPPEEKIKEDSMESKMLSFPNIGWDLSARSISLNDNKLIYQNGSFDSPPVGLNYNNLNIDLAELEMAGFQFADTAIKAVVRKVRLVEHSGFELTHLKTDFMLHPGGGYLNDFYLSTPHSQLEGDLELEVEQFDDLTDVLGKATMSADFQPSNLAIKDLKIVTPFLAKTPHLKLPESADVKWSGLLAYERSNLRLEGVQVQVEKESILKVDGRILAVQEAPVYDLDIGHFQTSYASVSRWTEQVPFAAALGHLGQVVLSGQIKGTLGDLSLEQLQLSTDAATSFQGDLKMTGLPDIEQTRFDVNAVNLKTMARDIEGFTKEAFPAVIDSLGLVEFTGAYEGTIRDFRLAGHFTTEAGNLSTLCELVFNQDYTDAKYQGQLQLDTLNVGRLLGDTSQFKHATLNAVVEGEGLNFEELKGTATALVTQFDFNQYEYKGLEVEGQFDASVLKGNVQMKDEHLSFGIEGMADFKSDRPTYDIALKLDTINLEPLHFYQKPLSAQGVANIQLKGHSLDDFTGMVHLEEVVLQSAFHQFTDDAMLLTSRQLNEQERQLKIETGFLQATMTGQYNFSDLPYLLESYVNDFFSIKLMEGDSMLQDKIKKDQAFTFDIQLKEVEKFTRLWLPDLQPTESRTSISGGFDSQKNELLVDAELPPIEYQGAEVAASQLKIIGSEKDLSARFSVKNLQLQPVNAPFVQIDANAKDHVFSFDLLMQDDSLRTLFQWGGDLVKNKHTLVFQDENIHLKDAHQVSFRPTMVLNEALWQINPGNRVDFNNEQFYVQNLLVQKGAQSIAIASQPIEPGIPLRLLFSRFELSEISALLNQPDIRFTGYMDGALLVKEPQKNLHYNAGIEIKELSFNEGLWGDMRLSAAQVGGEKIIDLLAQLNGENKMELKGQYDIPNNQFELQADLGRLSLGLFDPFLSGLIQDSKGTLSGLLTLSGSPQTPLIKGQVDTKEISTFVVLAGSRYKAAEHRIQFTEKEISLGNIDLFDESGRKAVVNGAIHHTYFDEMEFDIQVQTDGLKILDTERADNPLYYGQLFASADVRITGTPALPKLNVVATTLDSSLLHVEPLLTSDQIVQEDYVIFANPNDYAPDSLLLLEQQVGKKKTGFDLSLKLIVTPAAQLNIIIDPLTGDELYCSGTGNFTILMDPTGDLDITGTYTIEEGAYSFAYEGLVKRNFDIRKNSRLAFSGNPYDAIFDITASYNTRASTYELISNEVTLDESTQSNSQRRTDVEVLLNIDGQLSEPVITFDIALPQSEGTAVDNLVIRKLDALADEPTELNKQVFGLLLFNSFIQSSTGTGLANVGENAALKSASNLVSNQLNALAGRFVKGVDLSLGVESYKTAGDDASTVSEVKVGLSKQLFNDRLTIEVGGNLNLESSQQSALESSGYSAIAGDFVLEYKINERGNYRVKVFHKSDYNVLLGGNSNKTGLGIMFKKSY